MLLLFFLLVFRMMRNNFVNFKKIFFRCRVIGFTVIFVNLYWGCFLL